MPCTSGRYIGSLHSPAGSVAFTKKLFSADIGRDHIIRLVGGIIFKARGENTAADVLMSEILHLRLASQDVAYAFPVDQITAMENGHSRHVGESGGCYIIVPSPLVHIDGSEYHPGRIGL